MKPRKQKPQITPIVQGAFFLATGLWPLVHLRSFEAVTGPKTDRWLVKTFGALTAAVGASLIVGGVEGSRSRALPILGAGAALALAGSDLAFVKKGMSRIYLADAVVEFALTLAWLAELRVLSPWTRSGHASRRRLLN